MSACRRLKIYVKTTVEKKVFFFFFLLFDFQDLFGFRGYWGEDEESRRGEEEKEHV